MPPQNFYEPKTPTLESPGEKSIDLTADLAANGDYGPDAGDAVLKAIWVGGAGNIAGFKLRDDTAGTARVWAVPAGVYLLGPFVQINDTGTTATGLIGEYF